MLASTLNLVVHEGADDSAFLKTLTKVRGFDKHPTWQGLYWHSTRGSQAPHQPRNDSHSTKRGSILTATQQARLLQELSVLSQARAFSKDVRLFWLVDTDTFSEDDRLQQIQETWWELQQNALPNLRLQKPKVACVTPYLEALYTQALHQEVRHVFEPAIQHWESAVQAWYQASSNNDDHSHLSACKARYATSHSHPSGPNIDKKRLQAYLMALPFPYQQCKWSNPNAVQALVDLWHPCFDAVADALVAFL